MNNETQIGRKTNLYEVLRTVNNRIEIPIIQRDYAQGRGTAKNIRNTFLKSIYNSLVDDTPLHLDFIYGNIYDDIFYPLDGQQRLTTLFLLHWYIATKEEEIVSFRSVFTKDGKSRFTYETRKTSREFCNALVSENIEIPKSREASLSQHLKNSHWYFLSWDKDPTISSMMVMLDSIHTLFYPSHDIFARLFNEDSKLSFHFIELKDFGLSDELYIKMNARGKGLTDFENFKARFSRTLEKNNNVELQTEFNNNIDSCWTDLFWPFRDRTKNIFDDQIMNFIHIVLTNYFSLVYSRKVNEIQRLLSSKSYFNYYDYEELGCFCSGINIKIIDILKSITDDDNSLRKYLANSALINEEELFKKMISFSLTNTDRLQVYAVYEFIVSDKSIDEIDNWMRIMFNLTENTRIEDHNFLDALKSINSLLGNSENILEYLTDENNKLQVFANLQVEEERLKAILLLKSDRWRDAIIKVEKHKYFRGQIGFLLDFTDIGISEVEEGNLKWSNEQDEYYFKKFNLNVEKAIRIFNDSGLAKFEDNLFERALLSIGDYLLYKQRNNSFCTNGKDRDISWKRLLRDKEKRKYVKELFSKIDPISIENDLVLIIGEYSSNDWRKHFIEYPQIINILGRYRFIKKSEDNDILLLEKTKTNGIHYEYYTYALYCKLKEMGNNCFYQHNYAIDYPKFIKRINDHKLIIKYDHHSNLNEWKFKINYNEDVCLFSTEDEVIDYLKKENII